MTFGAAVRSALTNYWNFRGRASRSEYWWFFLLTWIVERCVVGVTALINAQAIPWIAGAALLVLLGGASIALFIPALSLAVRRLHDVDRSGVWLLVPPAFFALLAAFIVVFERPVDGRVAFIWLAIPTLRVLIWHCTKGSSEPNEYGDPT